MKGFEPVHKIRKKLLDATRVELNDFKDIDLISFDVFDTLVTRKVSSPSGIFNLMQYHLERSKREDILDILKNDFYNIRKNEERLVRSSRWLENKLGDNPLKEYAEITFDEIYESLKCDYGLSDDLVTFLKNLEIETEKKNLVVIKKNLDLLKSLISSGKRVILISDMYYPEKTMRDILCTLDDSFKSLPLYVSCDYGVAKGGGGDLYRKIQEIENVSFDRWCHCGDNYDVDIKNSPTKKVVYHKSNRMLPYEEELLEKHPNTFSELTVGVSKILRSNYNQTDYQDVYDFGTSFVAPILYNYVKYILQQASLHGYKTLYFVARDALILKLIADKMIEIQKLDIKTKYIYGSRLVWRIPTETTYDPLIRYFFYEYIERISPAFIAHRLGIDKEECKDMMGASDIDTPLLYSDIIKIRDKFLSDKSIRERIIEVNRSKASLSIEYLKQELDLTQKDIVFVDSLGSGLSIDCVAKLLGDIKNIKTYYMIKYSVDNSITTNYSFGLKTIQYDYWLEVVLPTLDGTTLSYKKENDKIIPVTEENKIGKYIKEWGYDTYTRSILDYVELMLNTELTNNIDTNTLYIYNIYRDFLLYKADKTTAKVFGNIPYDLVNDVSGVIGTAPKISLFTFISKFLFGGSYDIYLKFPTIVLKRSSWLVNKLWKFVIKYKSLRKLLISCTKRQDGKIISVRILGIKTVFK